LRSPGKGFEETSLHLSLALQRGQSYFMRFNVRAQRAAKPSAAAKG